MTRRRLISVSVAPLLRGAAPPRFMKGICYSVFPPHTPYADCIRMARGAGFDAIELRLDVRGGEITLESNAEQMLRLRDAAAASRISIASLWVLTPSSPSLAAPDPAVRATAQSMLRKGIELAPALGADALLVSGGVLGRGARFEATSDEAWERSRSAYSEVLPLAATAKILLTLENVWSKFLVSPRDMRSFIDQFNSPWVQAHFDVGNVMQYGYPQDWILTLGPRIRRVHFKDYKLAAGGSQGSFVPLLEGDVEWREVMSCFNKIGYRGFVSAEVAPATADPEKLLSLSRVMDRILSMA